MSVAASLIGQLAQLGVVATADGHALHLRPASAIPTILLADLRRYKVEVLALLTAPGNDPPSLPLRALDPRDLPAGLCPGCGKGGWWRASVLSGGTGPWRCVRCKPPDPAVWIDAHAVPDGETRSRRSPRVLHFNIKLGLPNGAVYIGRAMSRYGLPASRWANPFHIGAAGSRAEVIARYRAWICEQPDLMGAVSELRGRNLVCWCAPEACHGDALLQLANGSHAGRPAAPRQGNRVMMVGLDGNGDGHGKEV